MQVDFNDSQLPPFSIGQMYKNLIVELPDKEHPGEQLPAYSIPHMGENQQQILVMVKDITSKYISDPDFRFLSDILSACKITVDDIALVNFYSLESKNYAHIMKSLHPKAVLLFGISPMEIELPVNFPLFQVQSFRNISFLSSPDLNTIEGDKLVKSKLWLCLKQMFML
jgi:hypothetical protein